VIGDSAAPAVARRRARQLIAALSPVVTDEGEINVEAAAKGFPKRGFSPYANRNYPTRVLWGDEQVHTGWSVDTARVLRAG
jgi:hypothetical protein